jgi:hypothetical protein
VSDNGGLNFAGWTAGWMLLLAVVAPLLLAGICCTGFVVSMLMDMS